jgi:hypothetical protein
MTPPVLRPYHTRLGIEFVSELYRVQFEVGLKLPSSTQPETPVVITAYPRRHETLSLLTPNLDWNAEFRNAESRFSQLLYH